MQSDICTHQTTAVWKSRMVNIWHQPHVVTWSMTRVTTSQNRSHSMQIGTYPASRLSKIAAPKVHILTSFQTHLPLQYMLTFPPRRRPNRRHHRHQRRPPRKRQLQQNHLLPSRRLRRHRHHPRPAQQPHRRRSLVYPHCLRCQLQLLLLPTSPPPRRQPRRHRHR